MDPDEYQKAWRAMTSQMRVTFNTDVLLNAVQFDQRTFRAMLFWQDCRAVGIALLMLPVWLCLGVIWSLPWTWYLTVPALAWVAGFVLVDRVRHQQPSAPDVSLLRGLRGSLSQVEHQIWLFRNMFWWYLLPSSILIPAFFVHVAGMRSSGGSELLGCLLLVIAIYAVIYFLNQLAVRLQLEPRRRELLTLIADLCCGDQHGQLVVKRKPEFARRPSEVLRPLVLASFCSLTITWIALSGGLFDSSGHGRPRNGAPAVASFTALMTDLR